MAAIVSNFSDCMTEMRTNPLIDNGGGRLNSLGEGLFKDYPSENTLSVPAHTSQQMSQDNDGCYEKGYNNGRDVIKNSTLLQKSLNYLGEHLGALRYVASVPYVNHALIGGGLLLSLFGIACGAPTPIPTSQPTPDARNTAPVTASAPVSTKGPVLVPATEQPAPTIVAPTVAPTPISPVATPIPTPIPILGNDYQERLVRAGYSRDIAERIASLRYSETNRRFADELLLIGEKAGYAQERMVKLVLPFLEDEDISEDELVKVTDPDGDKKDNETEIREKSNVFDRLNRLPPVVESFAVLDDELYAVVAGNDNLSYAFNLKDFQLALKLAPQTNGLIQDPQFTKLIFSQYVKSANSMLDFAKASADGETIQLLSEYLKHRWDLSKKGKTMPLNLGYWQENFPDRNDQLYIFTTFLPPNFVNIDGLQDWNNLWSNVTHNLKVINSGEACQRVEKRLADPTLHRQIHALPNPTAYNIIKEAVDSHPRALANFGGWTNTAEYFQRIDEVLKTDSEIQQLRLIFGYALTFGSDSHDGFLKGDAKKDIPGQFSQDVAQWYAAACGGFLSVVEATYPDGRGWHDDVVYFLKKPLRDKLLKDPTTYGRPLIGVGGSVSFYSPLDGLQKDYANQKRSPLVVLRDLPPTFKLQIYP